VFEITLMLFKIHYSTQASKALTSDLNPSSVCTYPFAWNTGTLQVLYGKNPELKQNSIKSRNSSHEPSFLRVQLLLYSWMH